MERRERKHALKFLKDIPEDKREEKFLKMAKNSHEEYPIAVQKAVGRYNDIMHSN